jgi:hypothetical protein
MILKHFAQGAMKISLTVQIMCSKVSAAIDTRVIGRKDKYI